MTFVVNITSNGVFVKGKEGDVHKKGSIGHREIIAKLGTRPKGGSPKDNFELRIADLKRHRAWGNTAGRNQRSEIRRQRSGVKLQMRKWGRAKLSKRKGMRHEAQGPGHRAPVK
jgi:hypothetical protein